MLERRDQSSAKREVEGMLFAIDSLNSAAWSVRHSDTSKALEQAEEAARLSELSAYQLGSAYSLVTQCFAHFRLSRYKQALELGQQALDIFKTLDDSKGQQRTLNTLGMIYAESGDLSGALRVFLHTQKLCETLGEVKGEADALNNIAIVYSYLGDYVNSLESQLKSLALSHQIGFRVGEMKSLINIATIYLEQDKPAEALEYLHKSLDLRSQEDPHTYAVALGNLARAYRGVGNLEQALHSGSEGLQIMESLGDTASSSYTLNELGNINFLLGHYAQSEQHFRRSLSIMKDIGDRKGEAESLLLFSKLLRKQEQSDAAISALTDALGIARDIGAQSEIAEAHLALSTLYKNKGAFEQALSHLNDYLNVKETLSNDMSKKRFEALRVKFETEQTEKEKEIYRLRTVELADANAKLEELSQELFRQANEDPLTGLFNRRRLEQELGRELERARRSEGRLSVMICDIDNFKQVNDRFSHQTGDFVLQRVAQLLKRYVRGADVVARYGGEEFVILFPEASAEAAQRVCERLRENVANAPWHELHADLKITLSMGICDDTSLVDGFAMIDQADDRLYEAKRNGKNQVRI
jgi:diguanylate cyclase (GGDEF)-like protein